MDSIKLKWCKDVMGSVDDAMQRIKKGTFNHRQHYLLMEITGDLINALEDSDANRELAILLREIQGEFENPQTPDINLIRVSEIRERIKLQLNETEKINYIQIALQLDVQSIMPLLEQIRIKQEEVRQILQKAVDIDFLLHGEVSMLTTSALEAFHFNIDSDKNVIAAAEIPKEDVVQNPTRKYLKIPPQGKKQFKETVAFLNDNGAKFDGTVKKWYITEHCDHDLFKIYLEKSSLINKLEGKKQIVDAKVSREQDKDIFERKSTLKHREEAI
jgi:hypothetical protein